MAALGAVGVSLAAAPSLGSRPPRPVERQAIVTTLASAFGEGRSCFTRDLYRISTVDSRYALWSGGNRYRQGHGCLVGDGYIILRRRPNGRWLRRLDAPWQTAPCAAIGSRVARDLTRLPCS
jgi:hypothetical protein